MNYREKIEEQQEMLLRELDSEAETIEDAMRIAVEHLAICHLFIEEKELIGDFEEWLNEKNVDLQMGKYDLGDEEES